MKTNIHLPWLIAFVTTASFCLCTTSYALEWKAPDHGFIIQVDTPNGIPQKSGASAKITGKISLVGAHIKGEKHNDAEDDFHWKGSGHNKEKDAKNLLDLLGKEDVQIKVYFPDFSNEITKDVIISTNGSDLTFTFNTPALKKSDLNLFVVQVLHQKPENDGLKKLLSKLEIRDKDLLSRIRKLTDEKKPQKAIDELKRIEASLRALIAKTNDKFSKQIETLAEVRFPLQVDNQISGPSYSSVVMNKFRLSVSFDLGSAIEGEKTTAQGKITSLRKADDTELADEDRNFDDEWLSRFFWQGGLVKEIGPTKLSNGGSLEFSLLTEALSPINNNLFQAAIYSWDSDVGTAGKRFGHLDFELPVAEDSVAPKFLAGGTPDNTKPYIQNMQPIFVVLSDDFGLINRDSILIKLIGAQDDGTAVDLVLNDRLSIVSADSNQSVVIQGDINPLAEGQYSFSIAATDFAGNNSIPNPLLSSFRIDRSSPVIQLGVADHLLTNQANLNIPVTIQDKSPTETVVLFNGNEIKKTNEKEFVLTITLAEGVNNLKVTSVDAAGNSAGAVNLSDLRLDTTPPILGNISPENDHWYNSLGIVVSGSSSEPLAFAKANNQELVLSNDKKSFSGLVSFLNDGDYDITISVEDRAKNSANITKSFHIDHTQPAITLGIGDHILTKSPAFELPISVIDFSTTNTRVTQNENIVFDGNLLNKTLLLTLLEGINVFEITSTDAANNISVIQLSDVVLDSTQPVLLRLEPPAGTIFWSLDIPISGLANESLSYAKINDKELLLSTDKTSFSGIYSAQTEGQQNIQLEIADPAGNIFRKNFNYEVILKILNGSLISVIPEFDGTHLLIKGAPGATRSGLAVNASAGLFNNQTITANFDGSFLIKLDAFTSATVSATDPATGKREFTTVYYGSQSGTRLGGSIRDTDDNPIPGVTVSILGTTLSTTSDATGIFQFQEPITGDQVLIIDGSTALQSPPPAPQRKFSSTRVSISIGLNQSNVLKRPIYLTPIPLDGSAQFVSVANGASVSAINNADIKLDIPPNTITFPSGSNEDHIAILSIPADRSTVATPKFSTPKQVVSLEPSGLSFSKPVQLTLPNVDELPPNTDVVILSMNSKKGIWEIDGAATISEDGRFIITKPNMGISHFSIVYASPLGPKVSQIGAQDKPGADTFNGAVTASISTPSLKAAGATITPTLIYKSTWAKPTALISHLFDLPREEITYEPINAGGGLGTFYRNEVTISTKSITAPEYIKGQFFTTGITSSEYKFTGLPDKAKISYAIDLKNQQTNKYLATDVYPYQAQYTIQYKNTFIKTTEHREFRWWGDPDVYQDPVEMKEIEKAFPSNASGAILVQNESTSPVGRGWKIQGVQKIANPTSNQIMIEEGDGSISSYVLDNRMTVVFDAKNANLDLSRASDVSQWPIALLTTPQTNNDTNTGRDIVEVDLITGNKKTVGSVFGNFSGDLAQNLMFPTGYQNYWYCMSQHYSYSYTNANLAGMFKINQSYFITDSERGFLYNITNGSPQLQFGDLSQIDTRFADDGKGTIDQFCNANHISCTKSWGMADLRWGGCWPIHWSEGLLPRPTQGATKLNKPMGITAGLKPNTLVIADSGNYGVKLLDLSNNSLTTIAGNDTTNDTGDGGLAINAGIASPRGVAYDTVGNLYISTSSGRIRVVDTAGRISTLVGSDEYAGPGDNLPASKILFNAPTGMVIDNNKGYLYIAENGAHAVRKVDLSTKFVSTVAGNNFTPGNNITDNLPALNTFLINPTNVGLDPDGNLLVVDSGNQKIRKVIFQNSSNGILSFSPSTNDHSTLSRNADGTWIRHFRSGLNIYYDTQGRQIAAVDRAQRATLYNYDSTSGYLSSITLPTGKSIQYNYQDGKLSSITDPANRSTRFFYSIDGLLTQVLYPNGTFKLYDYDSDGLLLSEQNENGVSTKYTYNEWSRVSSITRAYGTPRSTTTLLNDSGSATSAKPGVNNQLIAAGSGQLADGIIDAKSVETKFIKDSNGYISTIIDADNNSTLVKRDLKGKPTEITRPDGTKVIFTYDISSTSPEKQDDLISQTDSATGINISKTYDIYGNILTETNGRGFVLQNEYSTTSGLLLRKTAAYGTPIAQSTSYAYNHPLRLITEEYNSQNKLTSYNYDANGNLIKVIDPLGNVTQYTRDDAGNAIIVQNAKNQFTCYRYDEFNRLLSVKSGIDSATDCETATKGTLTRYEYSPTGALTKIFDPQGNSFVFEYDELDRLIRKFELSTDNDISAVTTRTYDANGNVLTETDPNNNFKQFEYDKFNRLKKKILPDNIISMDYDIRGQMTAVSNSNSVIRMNYDLAGRLVALHSEGAGSHAYMPSVTLNFTYDFNGNRNTLTDPTGVTSFGYDELDRLISLVNHKNENYSFSYDTLNRLRSINRPGSTTLLAFDDNNFLTSITHSSGGNTLAGFEYMPDKIGNKTEIKRIPENITRTLAYDGFNQIISASNPEATGSFGAETFTYDSIHNRLTDQNGSYLYDSKNKRLNEDYRYYYFYDANGNLTSKQSKNGSGEINLYYYSSENQLMGINMYSGGVFNPSQLSTPVGSLDKEIRYAYDALGRRAEKFVVDHKNANNSFTRRYVYDNQEILLEYDENNNILAKYTHSGLRTDDVLAVDVTEQGKIAGLAKNPGSYQYLKDGQGTITDISNNLGAKIQRYIYSVFGELLEIKFANISEGVNTSYSFTGRERDSESGMYYYRARYYDANIGRFLQRDPHPGDINTPSTVVNNYNYCGNNPGNFSDPSGRFFLIDDLLVLGIAAIAGGIAESIAKNGFTLHNILVGIAKGLALGSSLIGVSSLFTAATSLLLSPISAGSANTIGGLISGGLATPAAAGTFDPNASSSLKAYSSIFTWAGIGLQLAVGGGLLTYGYSGPRIYSASFEGAIEMGKRTLAIGYGTKFFGLGLAGAVPKGLLDIYED